MIKLYLMCGPAGCGKSTWAKAHCKNKDKSIIISRDEIRFLLVKEDEEYFSKETEVFNSFINKIQSAIALQYEEIYVDATHLNEKSRNKVLDKIKYYIDLVHVKIIPVCFAIELNTCIKQNSKRKGRCQVPINVIANMFVSYEKPSFFEKYKYTEIIEVNGG